MKKTILPLIMSAAAAVSTYAAIPANITEDCSGEILRGANYTIMADDVTVTHSHTGARHYVGTFNLNGHSATLVLSTSTSTPTTAYFAFDRSLPEGEATFRGNSAADVLDIKIADGKDPAYVLSGFIVDSATVNMGLGLVKEDRTKTVDVINGGVLNWTGVAANGSYDKMKLAFNVGNSASDNSKVVFKTASQAWFAGVKMTVNGGTFDLDAKSGRFTFSQVDIKNLSADAKVSYMGVEANGTFNIDSGIAHKILSVSPYIAVYENATLKFSTENAVMRSNGDAIGLEFGSTAKTANFVMGATQTINDIRVNGAAATLNLSLNGNEFTLLNADFTKLSIVIDDFDNNLFRWKNGTVDLSKITAIHDGITLGDLTTKIVGDYTYLFSASIPEPATVAAVFGALALGLALHRRRK